MAELPPPPAWHAWPSCPWCGGPAVPGHGGPGTRPVLVKLGPGEGTLYEVPEPGPCELKNGATAAGDDLIVHRRWAIEQGRPILDELPDGFVIVRLGADQ